MYNLSIMQVLTIWTHLERALADEHNYGGNIAEIYFYQAMPMSPMVEANRHATPGSMVGDEVTQVYRTARESFLHVFRTFAEMRNARISIEEKPDHFVEIGDWFVKEDYRHRVHVQVVSRAE